MRLHFTKNLVKLKAKFYKLITRSNKKLNLTLVDIGASYFLHKPWEKLILSDSAQLWAFDPNSKNLRYLDSLIGYGNIHKFHFALGQSNAEITFYVTNVDSGSSIYEPSPSLEDLIRAPSLESYLFPYTSKTLETKRLDDLPAADKGFFSLKIDTQGSELDILKGASNILKSNRILSIEMEISTLRKPVMAGSAQLDEVLLYLKDRGFDLMWVKPNSPITKWPFRQKRQTELDALFILNKERVIKNKEMITPYVAVLNAYRLKEEIRVLNLMQSDVMGH